MPPYSVAFYSLFELLLSILKVDVVIEFLVECEEEMK